MDIPNNALKRKWYIVSLFKEGGRFDKMFFHECKNMLCVKNSGPLHYF